jgi:hypothetical protein
MSWLWYNDEMIQCYLRDKRQTPKLIEHDLGHPYAKKLYAINQLFSTNPKGMLHDISGHVPHVLNVVTQGAYQYYLETRSFGQICLDTAENIAKHTDLPLAVNWSGGIDSTSALVAILQTVPWDRITVVCTAKSIKEYPEFYKDIVEPHLKTIDPTAWLNTFCDYFTISGDAGDTVWATIDDSFYQSQHQNINLHWANWIDQTVMPDLEFVEEFCSWSQVDIKSVLDLRTWFYLCCKWQDKAMNFFINSPGITNKNGCPFYDFDNSFRAWTMNNLDKIIGNSWNQYKMPAKEFIYKFHACNNYLQNKTKKDSIDLNRSIQHWQLTNQQCNFDIDDQYQAYSLPSSPFLDMYQFQDFNQVHNLVPEQYLRA